MYQALLIHRIVRFFAQALLRALVELVTPTNPSIANSIKGGDEVMRDLASSEYSCRYVTYVEPWVKTIKRDCTAHEQLCILAELFKSITEYEQKIICCTFL